MATTGQHKDPNSSYAILERLGWECQAYDNRQMVNPALGLRMYCTSTTVSGKRRVLYMLSDKSGRTLAAHRSLVDMVSYIQAMDKPEQSDVFGG